MPVHHFVDDKHLLDRGLRNYWGYNSIGYLRARRALRPARTGGAQVNEFKTMVKTLHDAGIEVILDVVYNHTAEGNHLGPDALLPGHRQRGLLPPGARRPSATTWTTPGRGNTLNMLHPRTMQLIMDSLRYWVLEMHVDGFRFDLASALARELHAVDRLCAFFDIIHQDPDAVAGQADRRAVGRRRGRLSGRQLPGALGRVERQVPRLRAPLLARRPGQVAELATA